MGVNSGVYNLVIHLTHTAPHVSCCPMSTPGGAPEHPFEKKGDQGGSWVIW